MRKILDMLNTDTGAIVFSAMIGFGLATIFRKTCRGDSCVVVTAPDVEELRKRIYEIDGSCYRYTPVAVQCDK